MAPAVNVLSFFGFLLSAYALWVRWNCRKSGYRPLCDISDRISCTKAFASGVGVTLGIPNPIYGVLFYPLVAMLWQSGSLPAARLLAVLAVLASTYLAYVSYKQRNFCVVCAAIYTANIAMLVAVYQ